METSDWSVLDVVIISDKSPVLPYEYSMHFYSLKWLEVEHYRANLRSSSQYFFFNELEWLDGISVRFASCKE